jgi:hypothetical protein
LTFRAGGNENSAGRLFSQSPSLAPGEYHRRCGPWRAETFKFSTDPQLEGKIRDVVGLYLPPPEQAVVLCVDEKPQIQALQQTAPTLPVRPGHPQAASFDYVRHGTTTLFAALEVATGKVTDACAERIGTRSSWPSSSRSAAAYPRRELHVVVDNLATHKHPAVRAWLARHPRVTLHFTPTSGSWLNLVEAVLLDHHPTGAAPRQLPHRGRPHRRDRALHQRLERPLCPVHLDQGSRHRPRQGHRPAAPQNINHVSYAALATSA